MAFGKMGARGGFGSLGVLGTAGVTLDVISDDFSAASLSSNWAGVVGTDPQAVAARIVSGAVAITSGDTSPGTTAADCSILNQSLRWKASHGNLSLEAKVKIDAITQVTAFVGFTDTLALERPGSVSGTTFSAVADNCAGFCFDTVSTPDTWFACGAKATVAQSTDTAIAPVANTYQTLKVTVDTSGTAKYYIDGVLKATVTNAVTANAAMTPVLMIMERTVAATRTLSADYLIVKQTLTSVLQEEDGTPFLVDMNFEASRFYYSGTMYRTFAAMAAAMGTATDNGDGTYTLGPNSNQPFSGYNTAAGTVVSEWTSTSQTLSLFVWTIQAASNANYWRRLTVNGTSQPEVSVNSGSAAQATFTFPASAERQTNYRFRAVDVMAGSDFSSHVNGELMGSQTGSGVVSAAATSVSAQIWHRAGASKLIGTGYRWAYSPRAISSAQRRNLSFLESNAVLAGAWTFFNDPRAIVIGGNVYAGAVEPQTGRFVVGRQGVAPVTLADLGEHDDHDNPAFLRRSSDNKILVHMSKHTDPTYYQALSTNADDMTAFGAATDIDSQLASDEYSYANLYEITDGIFNFHRSNSDATTYTLHYTKSTDNGSTWAADTKLVYEPGNRSYFKWVKGAANKLHGFVTDGHPNEFPTNSVWHFMYNAGAWQKSDGTAIVSALPFRPSTTLTLVEDGSSGGNCWVWGGAIDGSANPVVVSAKFPSVTDHRYRYAKWSGSAWVSNQVCTAGGSLYADGDGQDQYSGGICIDPDNVNIIYCSREVLSDGTIGRGGTHQLFKGVTADGGATWTLTQLTNSTRKCFRPYKVPGTTKLLYVTGEYHTYLKYQTVIAVMDV